MTEFNSNSFLIELDSFGRPPPPQNIYGKSETRSIASKLDAINMEKQKKMMGDMLPPSENGMVKLGSSEIKKKQQINPEDAEKWRNDVLAMSRPKAPGGFGVETAETAREYARQIRNSTQLYTNHSDSDEDRGTRSSSASNSLPSPPGELSSPYLRIRTDHHERKSSDYSSASSHKSQSPPSQSSYSDYASLYKSQTTTPSPRVDSPTKSFNQAFKNSTTSVPVVTVNTRPRFSPVSQKTESKTAPKAPAAPNFGYGPSLTQQVRVNAKPPSGRLGSVTNSDLWRRIENESDRRDRKLEELTKKLHENLVMDKKHEVGSCAHCRRPMYDTEDRYTVQESTYHSACFVCEVCGKELKDQQFYLHEGRFYCKQDYFTEQMVQQRDTLCAACKLPITETVLSTLHRHFHPKCFRCTDCYKGLDGIPFSADTENQPFCMQCYHNRYAPRCSTCKRPITPDPETGETIRVVALNNSYHESCYCCEGCNVTFDAVQKCYPLDGHLLCRNCHIHWAKTRPAPITDL